MKTLKLITFVLGTRPEAIKLAPVINIFKNAMKFNIRVISTGQHKEMADSVLELFAIKVNKNLNIMKDGQNLSYITTSSMEGLNEEFSEFPPDLVLIQGDTSTALSAALSAFYKSIPIGHIEAGLRTGDIFDPFPEEANRKLISQIASFHFAPTLSAKNNLLKNGISSGIYITGNTVVDALLHTAQNSTKEQFQNIDWEKDKVILMTVHRRENWGEKLKFIAEGVLKILNENDNVKVLFPMHLNKKIREPFQKYLGFHPNVILIEPLPYNKFVSVLKHCSIVLTDSGGLQEEAPSLGKPIFVLRDTTERQEVIESGAAKLTTTNPEIIFNNVNKVLNNKSSYKKMSSSTNPFGDGLASKRILDFCIKELITIS